MRTQDVKMLTLYAITHITLNTLLFTLAPNSPLLYLTTRRWCDDDQYRKRSYWLDGTLTYAHQGPKWCDEIEEPAMGHSSHDNMT
jgi:hypothetical protein